MKKNACIKIIMLLLLANAATLAGETFRVRKLFSVRLTGTLQDEQSVTTGINDSIAIFLPDDMTYLLGVEVKIDIPDAVAAWQNSVACSVYNNITPVPRETQIDYEGSRGFVNPLPARRSWIMQIPFSHSAGFKETPYTSVVPDVPDIKGGFVFIRIQPAMKGIPDETMNAELKISIKPLLADKGRLRVTVTHKEAAPKAFTLFIDETERAFRDEGWILSSGVHNVNIISEFYRSETRTVRIDQARMTALSIALKSVTPTLLIAAPANTTVYFDGELCDIIGTEFEIAEGEHTVRFLMDDYEVVRTLNAQKGKSYRATLAVDVDIREE